ncbi:hypothetical protein M231_05579 [Tremella mesenterica]|uniref:ACB domain-containing protein n=1 Tax=Tremella mesenterica TaxID=5217 RepID=A0A4Q1BHN5_TREME|nr:hypothetical protein M231_05579 [Tremella mesenterica]
MQDDAHDDFDNAANWLSTNPEAAKLSNETKLEIYGLYKYATTGDGPTGSRPSIFSPAPRAKHDAWLAQSTKYEIPDDARVRYIELAKGLGWDGAKVSAGWRNVSVMTVEDEPVAGPSGTIHDAVIDNDLDKVRELVNQPDLVSQVGEFGYTPLHLAADRGLTDMVRLLLANGADRHVKVSTSAVSSMQQ